MTGPVFLTIPAASTVSSQAYFERADKSWAVFVPSHAALSVLPQFSVASGGPWAPVQSPDQSGQLAFACFSGTNGGVGYVVCPPSPYFRIAVNTQTTAVMTFTIQARASH